MLFVLLFRMRTANDLRNQFQMFKNDIDDHYKLLVLSDLQVGEIMYNGKDITLSWDSTTINRENTYKCFNSTTKIICVKHKIHCWRYN